MRSERTTQCIKKKGLYTILSGTLCFGMCIALVCYGFATKGTGTDDEVANHIKAILIIGTISALPLLILSFLVKDKIKPTIRMVNVILSAYLVANGFMYVVGAIMLIDTYVITGLIKKYNTAIVTNKEIDLRGGLNGEVNIRREN